MTVLYAMLAIVAIKVLLCVLGVALYVIGAVRDFLCKPFREKKKNYD